MIDKIGIFYSVTVYFGAKKSDSIVSRALTV